MKLFRNQVQIYRKKNLDISITCWHKQHADTNNSLESP